MISQFKTFNNFLSGILLGGILLSYLGWHDLFGRYFSMAAPILMNTSIKGVDSGGLLAPRQGALHLCLRLLCLALWTVDLRDYGEDLGSKLLTLFF